MRRAVAGLTAVLLLHSSALRAGVLCAAQAGPATPTHDPRHGTSHHGSSPVQTDAPAHSHHDGDAAHCALMAACTLASVPAPQLAAVGAVGLHPSVSPARQFAPTSLIFAPDPPPPRG